MSRAHSFFFLLSPAVVSSVRVSVRSPALGCACRSVRRGLRSGGPPLAAVSDTSAAAETDLKVNFISNIMKRDLAEGKHETVVTRFPPEPNGYLHIGHAKSICINFGLGAQFSGRTFMRFDDTNPAKEKLEYIEAIQEDVRWLGFDWDERLTHASDYFDRFYEFAEKLIVDGLAYVDSLSAEQMREYRGTLTEPGRDSPFRTRAPDENLQLFRAMAAGEVEDGTSVLRLKIDMSAANMNMRDPVIYRVKRDADHPRTGTRWKVYPMYDFAHCLTDALEGITHSLCTLEFEAHRPLYEWILGNLPVPCVPRQIEFSRLNLQYCVVSKRKLLRLVDDGHVEGWDDPRMPTLRGLRRRGVPPAAVRLFVERTGVSKADNNIDYGVLEDCVRETLDAEAPRAMAVIDPLRVVVTTWAEGEVDTLSGPMHPKRPELGKRAIPFSRTILIERSDFMEDPPKKYFRLKPGGEVRLRFGYIIKCDEVIKDAEGNVIELRCSHEPDSRQGAGRKVKGIIHWVSEEHAATATVRMYDRLFDAPNPGAEHDDGDFLRDINPDSLRVIEGAAIEPYVADSAAGTQLQFERTGYFCVDRDSKPGALALNRVVTLRDTWAKIQKADAGGKGGKAAPGGKAAKAAAPSKGGGGDPAAVAAQAAVVRRLKEEEGLANGDPRVKEAVAELLRLKAL